jgi:endonuclease/exonuclease/phosphatase (EEP) superfamily protein YafD
VGSELRPRRVVIGVLVGAGWIVVGVLGVAAGLRVLERDRDSVLFAMDAYTFWLYLPAYLVGAGAAIGRRPWLGITATVLVVCHLIWVLPTFAPAVKIPERARLAPHFVLVTANLRFDNPTPEKWLQELPSLNADVLDLQEVSPEWVDRFRADGLLREFKYHVLAPLAGPGGTAVLSRYPIERSNIIDLVGDREVSASIWIAGHLVHLLAVHPRAPTDFQLWNAQRAEITAFARDAPRPLVLAGDFNTTQYNAWFGELKGLGLRSAHDLLGKGSATTWPNGQRRLPPIQVDHVLVSPTIVPLSIREGRGSGSDHKPVVVELALL